MASRQADRVLTLGSAKMSGTLQQSSIDLLTGWQPHSRQVVWLLVAGRWAHAYDTHAETPHV